jgi:hypothetical protein
MPRASSACAARCSDGSPYFRSELSARSGVPQSALRFYERQGLIASTRTDGNQRIRTRLTGCIGCGCLSPRACQLLDPDDEAARLGGGAHYLRNVSPHERDLATRAR